MNSSQPRANLYSAWLLKLVMKHFGLKDLKTLQKSLVSSVSLHSFLGPKVPHSIKAEQSQAALTGFNVIEEAQPQSKLKCALEQQSFVTKNRTYSLVESASYGEKRSSTIFGESVG